jgi:hypothetical protein
MTIEEAPDQESRAKVWIGTHHLMQSSYVPCHLLVFSWWTS